MPAFDFGAFTVETLDYLNANPGVLLAFVGAALLVAGGCVAASWRADVRRNRQRAEDAALAYQVAQARLQTVVRISDRRKGAA